MKICPLFSSNCFAFTLCGLLSPFSFTASCLLPRILLVILLFEPLDLFLSLLLNS